MKRRQKHHNRLREGFSTGACAAAAAKAATLALIAPAKLSKTVSITFPDGLKRRMGIHKWGSNGSSAWASVIKDAGDDPDITHGAEIVAKARRLNQDRPSISIKGGRGVGTVTKPGLPVEIGEAAINPVPRSMIKQAVSEAVGSENYSIEITIEVPKGKELARKTLNRRLGIVDGISILGTTGIVKPVSAAAWKATITAQMDVCLAAGSRTVVLATGRTSERAALDLLNLPEEAFITMGDYVAFSFTEAGRRPFEAIYVATQWSKLLKMALGRENTHVKFGPLEPSEAVGLLKALWKHEVKDLHFSNVNSAREIYSMLEPMGRDGQILMKKVMVRAMEQLMPLMNTGQKLNIMLVSYDGKVVAEAGPDDM